MPGIPGGAPKPTTAGGPANPTDGIGGCGSGGAACCWLGAAGGALPTGAIAAHGDSGISPPAPPAEKATGAPPNPPPPGGAGYPPPAGCAYAPAAGPGTGGGANAAGGGGGAGAAGPGAAPGIALPHMLQDGSESCSIHPQLGQGLIGDFRRYRDWGWVSKSDCAAHP